jgi:molecular chaperone GrpE
MEERSSVTDQNPQLSTEPVQEAVHDVEGTEATAKELLASQEIACGVSELLAEMQRLRQDFETKVKYDESKERLIDALHKELQSYREGLHFKILRPILIDLIAMYDDLSKVVDALSTKSSESTSLEIQNLQSFQDTIEEILRRNGVSLFEVEEDLFQGSRQRILRTVETGDTALDKRIARRVRKGFAYENRVLRPEIVEVYKYLAAATS